MLHVVCASGALLNAVLPVKTPEHSQIPQQCRLWELTRGCPCVSDTGLISSIPVNTALNCAFLAMLQAGMWKYFIGHVVPCLNYLNWKCNWNIQHSDLIFIHLKHNVLFPWIFIFNLNFYHNNELKSCCNIKRLVCKRAVLVLALLMTFVKQNIVHHFQRWIETFACFDGGNGTNAAVMFLVSLLPLFPCHWGWHGRKIFVGHLSD